MEPKSSLPHPQVLANCPYPGPDKLAPSHPVSLGSISVSLIRPSMPMRSKSCVTLLDDSEILILSYSST